MIRLKRLFFVTGSPGIGKTTVILKSLDLLKNSGFRVGGMISREVREEGNRVGFELIDLETGQKGWLAHVNQPEGPQIGKYRVNISDMDRIGAESILRAVANAQIVVVDEIGPMELHSSAFKDAVAKAVHSGKLLLGVIHQSARAPLIEQLRKRDDIEILEVTHGNRNELHKLIVEEMLAVLKS